MRQASRQSRKPERRRMATAVLRLLVLACALAVPGCASMGLSDALLSDAGSSFEIPSTIRSQNSAASDHESLSTSVSADYSPLQASAGSANSNTVDGNTAIGVVPVYASGHSFVQHRARLGKPIPLPDNTETLSEKGSDPLRQDGNTNIINSPPKGQTPFRTAIDGNAFSQTTIQPSAVRSKATDTTTGSQRPAQQHESANTIQSVIAQPSKVSFGSAGWQGIPNPNAADPSAKNTAAEDQEVPFATDGGWNREAGRSSQQNESIAGELTNNQQVDESGSALRPAALESAGGTQLQLDENSSDDATVGDTTTANETATAREPTVLDKLRGLYIPRRDESISKRNRKSTPRWTNPFGLLRDPEAETADATIGATTPLPSPSPAEAAAAPTEPSDMNAAVQRSEAPLEPLIAQMEKELAQWPTLPNGNARNEVEWRRRQTDLRMLYLIAGRSAESIRVIESLPEKEQEFWQSMMLAMESYRRSDDSAARAEQLTETLEYVRTASRQLQPLSTMKIRRLNFCNRIDGFGSFSVFPTSDFNAGQPLLLYAEIENYRSELTADSRYRSVFAAMIEFYREGETEPIATRTIRLPEIEDLCSAERTDYFQSYELTVPSLSPGKYTLRLRVRDQLNLQTATSELPFEIRPLGSQQ